MKISTFKFMTAALALLLAQAALAGGLTVSDGRLLSDGKAFVMRGVNYPFAWYTSRYPEQTRQDFANMAATGANAVRIVLSSGDQWTRNSGAQIGDLIEWSKDNRMIAILEVHDATGWGEAEQAVHISKAAAYWAGAEIRNVISGQEDYVIVNIANEPFGNGATDKYVDDTIAAIRTLREAGLTHNIMVDGANWGQEWEKGGAMRTHAPKIIAADPLHNVTFSVHMYEVYDKPAAVSNYMQAFEDNKLALIVGEFGADHRGAPVDEGAIMSQAQRRGVGYLGWSWSGNGDCCTSLDIVNNFGPELTDWGKILINGENGIARTAVPAGIFTAGSSGDSNGPAVSGSGSPKKK